MNISKKNDFRVYICLTVFDWVYISFSVIGCSIKEVKVTYEYSRNSTEDVKRKIEKYTKTAQKREINR
jgi:hypothetical protein